MYHLITRSSSISSGSLPISCARLSNTATESSMVMTSNAGKRASRGKRGEGTLSKKWLRGYLTFWPIPANGVLKFRRFSAAAPFGKMPKGVAPAHGNPSWSAIAFDLHLLSGGGRLTPAVYFKRLRYLLAGKRKSKAISTRSPRPAFRPRRRARCYNNLSYPCLGSLRLEALLG